MPKVHFNARDCTPLATCLEKHALFVFPYVRKGVHERALQELCGFGTLHKVHSIKAHVLSCLPWFYNKSNVWFLRCLLSHTMNVQCTFTTTPRWLHTTLNTNIFVCVVCCGGFPYTYVITDHFFSLSPTHPPRLIWVENKLSPHQLHVDINYIL